eukprot:Amastigsp_a850259_20.p5 type:complete len:102 gc:universal Amastigsp_a850259_20:449-144(-)
MGSHFRTSARARTRRPRLVSRLASFAGGRLQRRLCGARLWSKACSRAALCTCRAISWSMHVPACGRFPGARPFEQLRSLRAPRLWPPWGGITSSFSGSSVL